MKRDIIVVGATTGSVPELVDLLRALPLDLPAAVLAVVPLPPAYPSVLPDLLDPSIKLPVYYPKDSDKLVPGKVYLASPNHHLMLEKGKVRVCRSAEENYHRPAVDPLFRSAAFYGPRVAGVILAESDGDGTSGLYAIKLKRGVTILRDPVEALRDRAPSDSAGGRLGRFPAPACSEGRDFRSGDPPHSSDETRRPRRGSVRPPRG